VFRRIGVPSAAELAALLARIAERSGRALERKGWLERDCETSYLALDPEAWMSDDAPGGAAKTRQVYETYLTSRLESRQVFLEEAIRARSRHV
jgi:hypothetical protein